MRQLCILRVFANQVSNHHALYNPLSSSRTHSRERQPSWSRQSTQPSPPCYLSFLRLNEITSKQPLAMSWVCRAIAFKRWCNISLSIGRRSRKAEGRRQRAEGAGGSFFLTTNNSFCLFAFIPHSTLNVLAILLIAAIARISSRAVRKLPSRT